MYSLHFKSVIEIYNGNPYILVSTERAAGLKKGWRKPMPVYTRINGQPETPWSINMMPIGDGSFYLYLHGDVRKSSHTAVGDEVEVEIQFDNEYKSGPTHPMPSYLREALDNNLKANQHWEKLILKNGITFFLPTYSKKTDYDYICTTQEKIKSTDEIQKNTPEIKWRSLNGRQTIRY